MATLVPIGEAAAALGVSIDTLRRWERSGQIEMRRDHANRRVVPESEIRRLRRRDLVQIFERQHPGWKVVANFAGTDQLAAQVEQGQRADVFAGASPKYPGQLQRKHLLGTTRNFATNTLVVVVPASNPAGIASVRDLVSKRPKLVVGDPTVPIGAYTEQVLANLGIDEKDLNIVSREVD